MRVVFYLHCLSLSLVVSCRIKTDRSQHISEMTIIIWMGIACLAHDIKLTITAVCLLKERNSRARPPLMKRRLICVTRFAGAIVMDIQLLAIVRFQYLTDHFRDYLEPHFLFYLLIYH